MKLSIRIICGKIVSDTLLRRANKRAAIIRKAMLVFKYGRPGVDYYT